jgi:hypothetical protein
MKGVVRVVFTSFAAALFVMGLIGCGGEERPTPPGPRLVVLIDRSDHMQAAAGDACGALDAALSRYMEPASPDFAMRDKRAKLEVFLTGTPESPSPEQILSLKAADFVVAAGGLEFSRDKLEEAGQRRDEARREALRVCKDKAALAPATSIYRAIAGLAADLGRDCVKGQVCELLIYSDLYDPSEPWICASVYGERQLKRGGVCPFNYELGTPPVTDGAGEGAALVWSEDLRTPQVLAPNVVIRVCGVASGRLGSAAVDGPRVAGRRLEVWAGLFPVSDLTVHNYCQLL